nr:MAG TPA: hypothetical protein [Caudoviricetes sp.]
MIVGLTAKLSCHTHRSHRSTIPLMIHFRQSRPISRNRNLPLLLSASNVQLYSFPHLIKITSAYCLAQFLQAQKSSDTRSST